MSTKHYLAGLFDGEGYITINKMKMPDSDHTRYQLVCGINMTNNSGIIVAQGRYGGSIHFSKRKNPKHKDLHQWVVGSQKAYRFLKDVADLLLVKDEEAYLGISFQEHLDSVRYGHRTIIDGKRRSYPKEEMEYREGVYRKMRALKH